MKILLLFCVILFAMSFWIVIQIGFLRRKEEKLSRRLEAVAAEQLRSERFQAELITNVSHDIKTPMTSVISYLDFLSAEGKKEKPDQNRIHEYIRVLDRQSARLCSLLENLMEASRAASGDVRIEQKPINLGIFIQQIAGEYAERFEAQELILQIQIPGTVVCASVDGYYLSRSLDYLLQNSLKYAKKGTSVLLSLTEQEDSVKIILQNISAEAISISAEELMQRFVKGDRSRHSEGSGLGLSIVKNLIECQNGRFKIEAEGYLFKAEITFANLTKI